MAARDPFRHVDHDRLLAYQAERDPQWARADDTLLALRVEPGMDDADEDALAALP